jgi:hypothetical protein
MVGQVNYYDNQNDTNNVFCYRQKVVNQIIELSSISLETDEEMVQEHIIHYSYLR